MPFVSIACVRASPSRDYFYLHCPVTLEHGGGKSEVGCTINRFKLPSGVFATDRSKAVPHCVPFNVRFVLVCLLCVLVHVGCVCACVHDFVCVNLCMCVSVCDGCCEARFGEAAFLVRGIPCSIISLFFTRWRR